MLDWPSGTYDVIVIDPPWPHYGSPDKDAAAGKHYPLMSREAIFNLPVHDLCVGHSVVFLWSTCPLVHVAVHALEAWGLVPRGVQFVWVKTRRDGKPIGPQGVRPSIVKPLTELVLAGSFTGRGRPMPLASESVSQTVFAPRQEHSRKPEEVMERIEALYPDASKLELFARGKPRTGWLAWGDEVE